MSFSFVDQGPPWHIPEGQVVGVLGRVAAMVVGRRRWVLAISGLLVVAAAVFGAGAIPQLKGGGFEDEASLSYQAKAELEHLFGNTQANEVLLVTAKGGNVDDATVAADAAAAVTRLRAEPGVQVITDYWHAPETLKPGLRSTSGANALVLLHLVGDEDAVMKRAGELGPLYTTATAATQLRTGGFGQANTDITNQVGKDLALAEGIAVPITLILLVLVFGSVVSGTLPLLVGGMAIAATFAVLRFMAIVTPVSIFALNLTTALGLGLGIDYALLMVSRYREELAAGRGVDDAVRATVRTAGRTVLFSAVTIAASLAAMLVFPLYFLRSFAYAGIAVVLVAAAAAVVTLPPMLVLLGRRVEALPVGSRATRARRAAAMEGSGDAGRGRAGVRFLVAALERRDASSGGGGGAGGGAAGGARAAVPARAVLQPGRPLRPGRTSRRPERSATCCATTSSATTPARCTSCCRRRPTSSSPSTPSAGDTAERRGRRRDRSPGWGGAGAGHPEGGGQQQ